MLVNNVLDCVPIVRVPAMMTMAMSAAIRAYSMAAAPDSSFYSGGLATPLMNSLTEFFRRRDPKRD
jgi:hypothetical protein